MKPKALIFLYRNETTWLSCLKINRGLLEAYQDIAQVQICYLDDSVDDYFNFQDAIQNYLPEVIISFDHRISPSKLINYLHGNPRLKPLRDNIHILIHFFGNIQRHKHDWATFNKIATGMKIKFALASESHLNIFKSQLASQEIANLIPCILDRKMKSLISNYPTPTQAGKPLRIGYLGRLSRLKNIVPMIELFSPYLNQGTVELHLAGPFDDYDKPDITQGVGFYMKQVLELIQRQQGTYYHGVKKTDDEVYSFLAGLDGFCTFSTHPSEDFCFAVYEALSMGIPCLVNRWMALIDHEKRSPLVIGCDFQLSPNGEMNKDSIEDTKLEDFFNICHNKKNHQSIIDPVTFADSLLQLLVQPFSPFEGFQNG